MTNKQNNWKMKHDENKIEEIIEVAALCVDRTSEGGIALSAQLAMKQYAEHMVKQTLQEVEEKMGRILKDDVMLSECIQETLGMGHHYSTMPVARGIASRLEEKLLSAIKQELD